MRQILKKFMYNPLHSILGVVILWMGTELISDGKYWTYPPEMTRLLNDHLFGGIYLMIGGFLLHWVFIYSVEKPNIEYEKRVIAIATAVLIFLGMLQLLGTIATCVNYPWYFTFGYAALSLYLSSKI